MILHILETLYCWRNISCWCLSIRINMSINLTSNQRLILEYIRRSYTNVYFPVTIMVTLFLFFFQNSAICTKTSCSILYHCNRWQAYCIILKSYIKTTSMGFTRRSRLKQAVSSYDAWHSCQVILNFNNITKLWLRQEVSHRRTTPQTESATDICRIFRRKKR